MPTIKMEVEVVRGTHSTMMNQYNAMTQALAAMTSSVGQAVPGAWQGNSAIEFQSQYEQIKASMTQQLERLQQLATILNTEITQWETTAQTLG